MKYDDATWHYDYTSELGVPNDYAATHIGLFLKWCILKGWAGDLHTEEDADQIEEVVNGSMSGTDFLTNLCDCQLTDEDLNEEGNLFAQQYYGPDGLYLQDYARVFRDKMYKTEESGIDYSIFSRILDARLKSGFLTKSRA